MTAKPNTRTVLMVITVLLTFVSESCFLLKTDEQIDVVIAATDLAAGKKITEQDITITAIPVSGFTKEMPRKSSQVVGHTAKLSIPRGQLILLSNLEKGGDLILGGKHSRIDVIKSRTRFLDLV